MVLSECFSCKIDLLLSIKKIVIPVSFKIMDWKYLMFFLDYYHGQEKYFNSYLRVFLDKSTPIRTHLRMSNEISTMGQGF